jgi:hypothetical protein
MRFAALSSTPARRTQALSVKIGMQAHPAPTVHGLITG